MGSLLPALVGAVLLGTVAGGCERSEPATAEGRAAAYIAQLRDGNSVEREAAATALGRDPHEAALTPLRRAATRDFQVNVRAAALQALVSYGDDALEVLIDRLDDESERVRLIAVQGLGRSGSARAIEPLGRLLDDEEGQPDSVRHAVIAALGRLGPEGVEQLVPRFADASDRERGAIVDAVARSGDARHASVLIEALRAPDTAMRRRAAEALGKLGTGEAVEPILALVELIRDPIPEAERQRDRERAQRGPNRGDLRLIELALDEEVRRRGRGVTPGMHGWLYRDEDGARNAFQRYLRQQREHQAGITQRMAVRALADIGSDRARQTLRQLAAEDNESVARAVAAVYSELGQEALDDLFAIVKDTAQPSRARRDAVDLLVRITAADAQADNGGWASQLRARMGDAQDDEAPVVDEPQEPDAGPQLAPRLHDVLRAIASDDDPRADARLAVHCAAVLVRHDVKEAGEPLVRLLESDSSTVVRQAITALAELGEGDAAEPLLALAGESRRDRDLRAAAIGAVGRVGGDEAAQRLLEILRDTDSDLRQPAAEAIGRIGPSGMGAELVEIYKGIDGRDNALRRAMIETFGKVGAEEAVDLLIEVVDDYRHWVDVRLAMVALSHIGDQRAVEPIMKALRKEPMRIRAHQDYVADHYGIPALVRFNDPRAIDTLLYLSQRRGGGPNTPRIALRAIADIDHPEAVDRLIELLADPEIEQGMKEAAIGPALIDIGDAAVPGLLKVLREAPEPEDAGASDPGINAAELLAFHGWEVASKVLPLAEDPETPKHVLARVIICLREVQDDRAVQPLARLIDHDEPRVRRWAVTALGRMDQHGVMSVLHGATDHEDEQVRRWARHFLQERRDPQTGSDRATQHEPPAPLEQS